MKKMKLVVAALSLTFVSPVMAAEPSGNKTDPRVAGAVVAVGSAATAYLTRDVNLYRDALTAQPMDDAKNDRVLKATDELMKKSDTSQIPKKGLVNRARIAIKDLNRPQVTITVDTNHVAEAPSSALVDEAADNTARSARKINVKTVGARLLTKQNQTRTMDVRRDGGLSHLESQVKALKEDRLVVPAASVHSAGRRMLNKVAKVGVAGGAVLALGVSAKDLLELNLSEKDLADCQEAPDGSLSCSRVAKKAGPPDTIGDRERTFAQKAQ